MRNNRLPQKIAAALLAVGAVVGAVSQADAKLATNKLSVNGLSQSAINEQAGARDLGDQRILLEVEAATETPVTGRPSSHRTPAGVQS